MEYRADIDGLRAVAVLSVVLYHAFPSHFTGGFIGVDVFFVISGFLISRIIITEMNNGSFSFARFYARRIKRIFPALIAVLLFTFVFGWFSLLANEFEQLSLHALSSIFFLINFVLESESGYFDNASETKQLLHLWSLSVEEQFYVIWPILLLCFVRKIEYVIYLLLFSFVYSLFLVYTDPAKAFYFPLSRFWELIIGCLLSFVFYYNTKYRFKDFFKDKYGYCYLLKVASFIRNGYVINALSIFILFAYFFSVVFIDNSVVFPGLFALIPVVFAFLFICFPSTILVKKYFMSTKLLIGIGLISYPLYLWHWPLLSFQTVIFGNDISYYYRLVVVVIAFLLAWLTYKFIESPIRNGHIKFSIVKILISLMVLMACVTYFVYSMEGLPYRKSIVNYQNNTDELKRTPKKQSECFSFLNIKTSNFDYCRVKNIGSNRTVVLIGDSHAHVAFPGIASGLINKGFNTVLLANSSCPPFLNSPWGRSSIQRSECNDKINEIIKLVADRKDVDSVFIFTRGPVYWTGKEPSSAIVKKPSLNFDAFFEGMQNTLDALSIKFSNIYYVTENPELKSHPRDCLPRPFNSNRKNQCDVEYVDVLSRQQSYLNALLEMTNVTILNSLNVFCVKDKYCSAFNDGNQLLYADDDHLSVAGSEELYKILIEPLINDS